MIGFVNMVAYCTMLTAANKDQKVDFERWTNGYQKSEQLMANNQMYTAGNEKAVAGSVSWAIC